MFNFQERLIQLEIERGTEKADADLEGLVEKFQHLKQSIEVANETSEKKIDLKGKVQVIKTDIKSVFLLFI